MPDLGTAIKWKSQIVYRWLTIKPSEPELIWTRDSSSHARLCQLTFVLAAILKQSTTHMWRMHQGGWSWCLTWLCFTVWSTRYIHPSLHELCLSFLPFAAPLLWYLLCANLSQKCISWASLWFWYYRWGFGLRSMCYDLRATPLR